MSQSNHVETRSWEDVAAKILEIGLREGEAYAMLEELTTKAGHRLSGSAGAAAAVELTRQMMSARDFDNIHLEPIMVPHWIRGPVEEATIINSQSMGSVPLSICALGRSIATPTDGIVAEVVEVKSFEELRAMDDEAEGKIVFFNRAFDPTELNTFAAYGGAVDQRSRGAIEAAKVGGVAALVRSMTLAVDDVPHTGAMRYEEGVKKIPAAAVSAMGADLLSDLIRQGESVTVRMKLTCQTLPDVPSANVVGEITGSEKPHEIIVVGGHLDSWDKGAGAHDDGAGCVQAIEVLNLIKKAGLTPKRTIRAVMFMNEENGTRGAKAYPIAPQREGEMHIAAVESDRGGFAPRGFTVQADSIVLEKVQRWKHIFEKIDAGRIIAGYGGVDISPLVKDGVPGFGLLPENHRYFDYHHSDHDTIDKVHPRELEMGAIVEAILCYLISEEGL
ncbi:MAG: M20/M25/M40 family metallo-hydrolase [Ignavibacteria bacterium]|nr:M20/M25/M40 family metallo-hydrolase [Ignavibacteria bacterium]